MTSMFKSRKIIFDFFRRYFEGSDRRCCTYSMYKELGCQIKMIVDENSDNNNMPCTNIYVLCFR